MQAVTDMSVSDVKMISVETMDIKKVVKVPLVYFVMTAAMLASCSNITMKVIGAVLADEEYLYLVPAALAIAFTATRTLMYVNTAQLYYSQMEVMPVY